MVDLKHFSTIPIILRNRYYNITKFRPGIALKNYSQSQNSPSGQQQLKLMNIETILWPNLFKSVKNWIITTLIIRPYLDPDFKMPEFMKGAKQAMEIVSGMLSAGKLDKLELDGLVTRQCLDEIQKNMAHLSLTQRQELSISSEDIYFSFPYEIGIIFDDPSKGSSISKRSVEITVVFHALRGHAEIIRRGEQLPLNVGMLPEYRDKIFVLNYRFIRDYTKGVTDSWTLNLINHMKPVEHVEQ